MMDLFSQLQKMKILLIDDDKWIRHSLSLFFATEGCHLTVAETAEEGIEAFAHQDYDIILVDYQLPGMDGLEFLDRIHDSCPDALKILITAYGSNGVIAEARGIGVHDIIKKPFTSDTIEDALSRLIETREQGKEKCHDTRN